MSSSLVTRPRFLRVVMLVIVQVAQLLDGPRRSDLDGGVRFVRHTVHIQARGAPDATQWRRQAVRLEGAKACGSTHVGVVRDDTLLWSQLTWPYGFHMTFKLRMYQ